MCENPDNVTKTDIKSESYRKRSLMGFLCQGSLLLRSIKSVPEVLLLCFIWGYSPLMALQSITTNYSRLLSLSHYSSPPFLFFSALLFFSSRRIWLIPSPRYYTYLSFKQPPAIVPPPSLCLSLSLLHSSACTFRCLSLIIGSVSRSLADFPTGATFKRALDTSLQPASGF